jgi:hypothetical protein
MDVRHPPIRCYTICPYHPLRAVPHSLCCDPTAIFCIDSPLSRHPPCIFLCPLHLNTIIPPPLPYSNPFSIQPADSQPNLDQVSGPVHLYHWARLYLPPRLCSRSTPLAAIHPLPHQPPLATLLPILLCPGYLSAHSPRLRYHLLRSRPLMVSPTMAHPNRPNHFISLRRRS